MNMIEDINETNAIHLFDALVLLYLYVAFKTLTFRQKQKNRHCYTHLIKANLEEPLFHSQHFRNDSFMDFGYTLVLEHIS